MPGSEPLFGLILCYAFFAIVAYFNPEEDEDMN